MSVGRQAPGQIGDALDAAPEGPRLRIERGDLVVDIEPAAGGRIAQITHQGEPWLVDRSVEQHAMIAWGCYPMLPWAGRLREGRFNFEQREYQLSRNFGEHAIHGVGFALPWQVEEHAAEHAVMTLQLPENEYWPFGGSARHRVAIESDMRLRMQLTVTAGKQGMPVVLGWHPWFRKPEIVHFKPERMYPRDAQGIAVRPLAAPVTGPWDDCFVNHEPVLLQRDGQQLVLTSDCDHWVVYDEQTQASCFEPQTGPPDAFNLAPQRLEPGQTRSAWFLMEWQ
ncbi:aldose epimerase [Oleiagrimonas sp. C23AA]|uniref:aldose epimerase family protein n=1 Tax=Oleiagrimonas sp. C23AA TaxID=2719047 RepID=UPI00142037E6|nr:aldose epimerase [Oleiagrimonas sp. C23AA]NII09377.1 aldose epimerase [Oleiagrimonas sp. C23AA]